MQMFDVHVQVTTPLAFSFWLRNEEELPYLDSNFSPTGRSDSSDVLPG